MRCLFSPARTDIIKRSKSITNVEGVEQKEVIPCWWECKLVQPLWKTVEIILLIFDIL
jgi:hypothetical protein